MSKLVLVGGVVGVVLALAAAGAQDRPAQDAKLAPVRFLEGVWHGGGAGPYGAYEFETRVARRGRWLLLTSDVYAPGTDALMFVSTQVYGYDEQGLRKSEQSASGEGK